MDRKQKIIAALAIVGIGTGIALQFQKEHHEEFAPAPVTTPVQTASAVHSAAEVPLPHVVESSAPQAGTAFDGRIEPLQGAAGFPRDPLAGKPAAGMSGGSAHVEDDSPAQELVELNAPEKTHRIVDGDSLTKLAERYLGRADRYLEIYAYNRDVLNDPDVLPIGAKIRIPAHAVLPPENSSAAGITPSIAPSAELPLAPLSAPAAPAVAPSPGQASATPAAPAGAQRSGPRSYTVQAGDNLVDIARKMYGDGRKHEVLFQANRRTMKTPADLKVGAVLVVP